MNITVRKPGKPITEAELRQFEQDHNLRLPDDYRAFLLKHNGGFLKPNIFNFHWNGKAASSYIGQLYSLHDTERVSLEQVYLNSRSFTPSHYFTIANDHSKNGICISLKEDEFGTIYFKDTDEIDEDGYAQAYYVAPSFTAFLEMLYDDKPESE